MPSGWRLVVWLWLGCSAGIASATLRPTCDDETFAAQYLKPLAKNHFDLAEKMGFPTYRETVGKIWHTFVVLVVETGKRRIVEDLVSANTPLLASVDPAELYVGLLKAGTTAPFLQRCIEEFPSEWQSINRAYAQFLWDAGFINNPYGPDWWRDPLGAGHLYFTQGPDKDSVVVRGRIVFDRAAIPLDGDTIRALIEKELRQNSKSQAFSVESIHWDQADETAAIPRYFLYRAILRPHAQPE